MVGGIKFKDLNERKWELNRIMIVNGFMGTLISGFIHLWGLE